MRWLLILILFSFSADAQVLRRRAMMTRESDVPTLPFPASMGYRWEYTNLVNGAVSSWPDSIVGALLAQSSGPAQPTKDANGITFGTGLWLDATNALNCGTAGAALDVYLAIIKINNTGEGYLIAEGNNPWAGITSANKFYNITAPFGTPATGQWIDYVYAGKDGSNYKHYTNGVVAYSDASGTERTGNITFVGKITLGFNFKGTLKDLIVWTNVVGFDSLTVSNIHRYCTNRYSFSP